MKIIGGIEASLAVKHGLGKVLSKPPDHRVEVDEAEYELVREEFQKMQNKKVETMKLNRRSSEDLREEIAALARTVQSLVALQASQAPAQATLALPVAPEPQPAPVEPYAAQEALVGSIWYSAADISPSKPDSKDRVLLLTGFDRETGKYTTQVLGGTSKGVSYKSLQQPWQGFRLLRLRDERRMKFPPQE